MTKILFSLFILQALSIIANSQKCENILLNPVFNSNAPTSGTLSKP